MLLVYRPHRFRWTIAAASWRQVCRDAMTGAHAVRHFDRLDRRRYRRRVPSYRCGRSRPRARFEGIASPTEMEGISRVLVIGAGTRLLSAMSYYTIQLTNALAQRFAVAIIPMRQLIPTFLYPGRSRVGSASTRLELDRNVSVMGEIDWFWGFPLARAVWRLRAWRPDIVVFQWWTGSVLHTYLFLALFARLCGTRVIVEFHEVLDTAEQRIPLARAWVRVLGRPFFALADAFVIHSEVDREPIGERYGIGNRPCVVVPHGPIDHFTPDKDSSDSSPLPLRDPPNGVINLLFFGIIRPYKGLEDLVEAFEMLDADEVGHYWLTVVGETWEGWDLPIRLVEASRYRSRITLVNRFVEDDEVTAYFAGADAAVLPYHRSSASSPASVAMANGLPLVLTAVGGLPEAVADYEGAILVPPRDPRALRDAIRNLPQLCGRRYHDRHSWEHTAGAYEGLINRLGMPARRLPGKPPPAESHCGIRC
jgi:glycosyltransferase involved in cell wall biosynthesis